MDDGRLGLVLLAFFVVSSGATCSQFKQVGDSYTYNALNQNQIVANGLICEKGQPAWATCGQAFANYTQYSNGCELTAEGMIYARGFTNLSTPTSAIANIYATVSKSWTPPADYPLYRFQKVLHSELSGCFDGSNAFADLQCLRPKEAGYLTYTPRLFCVNGTLEKCTAESAITSGTAIHLCGVVDYAANEGAINNSTYAFGPTPLNAPSVNLIFTTPEAAMKIKNQTDLSNATCNHMTLNGLSNAALSSFCALDCWLGHTTWLVTIFWAATAVACDMLGY